VRKSLSLIEIIVVIVIITFVSSIALVSFLYITPKKIEATSRRITSELRWLRGLTAAKHQDHTARFHQNQNYIEFYEGSGTSLILIKTIKNLDYPITTQPSDDPLDLTFQAVVYGRKSIPSWEGSGSTVEIYVNGIKKVKIYKNTGCIEYVR